MLQVARLVQVEDSSASPYQEEHKAIFNRAYNSEKKREERKIGRHMTSEEFVKFTKRFSARWDNKWRTCFSKYIQDDLGSESEVTPFLFTGDVIL